MRRFLWAFVIAGITGAAFVAEPATAPRDLGLPVTAGRAQFAVCLAEASRSSSPVVATATGTTGDVSLSVVQGGTVHPAERFPVNDAGGMLAPVDGLTGFGPVVAELPTDVAAAAVVSSGELGIAGAGCTSAIPSSVILPGASTRKGEATTLVLANPFARDAVVTVTASSEVGSDSPPQLESVTVPAESVVTEDLSTLLPLRTSLVPTVAAQHGRVVPMIAEAGQGDTFWMEAIAPAPEWWLVVPDLGAAKPGLVIASDLPVDSPYQVDLYVGGEITEAFASGTVPAEGQVSVPLDEAVPGSALRVFSVNPLAASITVEGEGVRAASPGVESLSTRWLVPGPGALADPARTLWIFNPGEDTVDATVQPLSPQSPERAVAVDAGSVTEVRVDGPQTPGYLVQGDDDLVVFWTMRTAAGAALGRGTPLQ